jgi:hypothetical protein
MKVVAKDIETICHFSKQGIVPLRFKYQDDGGSDIVIKVDKIISKDREKLCGNIALIFDCQSIIDGVGKLYQLKYIVQDCKWFLFKI